MFMISTSQVRDLLLKLGADPKAKDNSGLIPAELFVEASSMGWRQSSNCFCFVSCLHHGFLRFLAVSHAA